jgi:hypothetical protein
VGDTKTIAMKDTKTIAAKRAFCTLLFPILVAGAGCTVTDNYVGSLAHDSGVADGPRQDASGAPAQPADGFIFPDGAAPDAASTVKDVAQESTPADRAVPDAVSAVKDAAPDSPSPDRAAPDAASAIKDAAPFSPAPDGAVPDAVGAVKDAAPDSPLPDGAAPDAVSAVKDAAPDSSEGGPAPQCQLNADGTCSAVTSNTSCAQFFGHRYDDVAGCFSDEWTTLGCCAAASGESCALPAQSGCYQVAATGGIYWTPALATAAVTIPGGQTCDETRNQVVPAAHPCRMPPDAGPLENLPRCGSDRECCVTVDWCYGRAQLEGTDPGPVSQFPPGVCLACIPPAIQVQCQGGYCVGTRLSIYDSSSRLLYSHCGYVAPPDAGAAHAVSPHAVVDGGQSYQTFWSCGGP